jgi:hypothetical protein
MIAGLLVVLAVLTVRARFDDPDMWWHLKTGEVVWTTHAVPTIDLFSFTTNHHAWVPHEWLSQLILYTAYRWGGYSGLMLWLCLAASAVFIAGYVLCTLYSGNAKVSFLGALIIFFFATIGLSIRPQMIGYLLLIFEMMIIYLGRARNPRWFWWLPPLFALWINCHGSFFLGLTVAGLYLFSSFFRFEAGSLVSETWGPRTRRTFILALVVSVAALFLNPDGIHQVLYPLDTLVHQPLGLSAVQEWQPMHLNSERGILFLLLLACTFLLVIARKSELYLEELLLLALGAWFAGSHERMLFVFGIFIAPILSRMLSDSWEGYQSDEDRPWLNAAFLALALLICFFAFPSRENLAAQVADKSPVKAVAFIRDHHLAGPMLNDFTDGGYLIWAMPEHPVFVDGRGDVYEYTGVLQEFGRWATLESDPNTLLDKYGIQFCLLEAQSPMTYVFPLMPNWKLAYSDGQSAIFVRTAPTATIR